MASPFRVFRKHQKGMMVILILVAMFGFIFGLMIQQYMEFRSAKAAVVVKTSSYGDLDGPQLGALMGRRQQVLKFLGQVQGAVMEAKRRANEQAADEDQVVVAAWPANRVSAMIGPLSEEAVVDTWLYAQHAEQLGLVVSDDAIIDFISEVTEDLLNPKQVKNIINNVARSEQRFFDVLRHELLALRVRLMFDVSTWPTPPAQRWEYYTRLKRLATIEQIPVPVADYTGKVKDPNEATLRAFFEKYKENEPDPTSPEPGFHRPHQVAVRYFKADIEKFMASEVVSKEEVKKFYEENKELFDRLAPLATEEPKPEEEPGAEKDPGEEPADEKQDEEKEGEESAEKPPAENEGEVQPEKEPAAAPPADDAAATEEGEEEDSVEQPAPEDRQKDQNGEEPSGGDPDQGADDAEGPVIDPKPGDPKPGDTSSGRAATPLRLISLLQEEAGEPEPVAVEESTEEPEDPAPEPESPAAEPADEPTDAVDEPAEGSAQPAEESPGEDPAGGQKQPEDPLDGPLGDMIRRQLAIQKIAEIFGNVQSLMNRYLNEAALYEVDQARDPSAVKPEEPDFEALARKYDPTADQGLTTKETSLLSQWDFRDEPGGIGQSFVVLGGRSVPFIRYAFEDKFNLYVATESSDIGESYLPRNRFLFWKVKDSQAHVPVFDKQEVDRLVEELRDEAAELESQRDADGAQEALDEAEKLLAEREPLRREVREAWKMFEARKLATKAAEDLADEARRAGFSLSSTFIERPDVGVVATRPFSWMTYGTVPLGTARTPPRLSEVTGVEMPGEDFMRTVFSLKKGEIAVTMNHPQTVAYVVRLSEINPPQDTLWAQFEVDNYGTYMEVASADRGRMYQAWQDELKAAAGLEWVRPPHPGQNE